nr:ribosomal protein L22 [Broussonetia papyrifera]
MFLWGNTYNTRTHAVSSMLSNFKIGLFYFAVANANHNMRFNEGSLIISKAEVNEDNTVKKLKPQARGRGYPIKRNTCHRRTIVLKDLDVEKEYLD